MGRKAHLLKMLQDELMGDEREEVMTSAFEGMEEAPMKATIMAEDKEGLIEGAKQVPKALSKAEEYMKMRLGDEESEEDEDEKKKRK